MKTSVYLMLIATVISSIGCSSITQSETQSLALTATYEGRSVDPVCQVKNDKFSLDAQAPSNITVRKSNEDLEVTCKKEGLPDGLLKAVSRAAGSMFGNIIFGGGIGALIDHSRGVGYDYPDQLPVKMGESVVVDKISNSQLTEQRNCQSGQNC